MATTMTRCDYAQHSHTDDELVVTHRVYARDKLHSAKHHQTIHVYAGHNGYPKSRHHQLATDTTRINWVVLHASRADLIMPRTPTCSVHEYNHCDDGLNKAHYIGFLDACVLKDALHLGTAAHRLLAKSNFVAEHPRCKWCRFSRSRYRSADVRHAAKSLRPKHIREADIPATGGYF